MLKILLFAVLCFFAVYGIARTIITHMSARPKIAAESANIPHTVLAVRNCADYIETTVRSYMWRVMTGDMSEFLGELTVIDLGSNDETGEILSRLDKEYDCVHIVTRDEYIRAIGEM